MKLNKRQLKALRGSIKKWEKIVAGTGKDEASDNCPICILVQENCHQCPVASFVAENKGDRAMYDDEGGAMYDCADTPYNAWNQHSCDKCLEREGYAVCKESKGLAKRELNFLRSMLPKKGDEV